MRVREAIRRRMIRPGAASLRRNLNESPMTALPAQNLLGEETSPYLRLHKDNPVHWRPWGEAALAEAQATGKPILFSSGYSSCHWCHVMAHESFEDAETAAVMNENFVCVKLDREERPDIDHLYQTSAISLGNAGGWPLTMFLLPNGQAFSAGTYFPKEESLGRPSFGAVLRNVIDAWRDRRDEIQNAANQVQQNLDRLWAQDEPAAINPNIIEPVSRRIAQRIDIFFGGFEGAPKFPQTPSLTLVWRAFMRTAAAPFGNAVALSLDNMSQGGVYDHLGGGYARYATDERWLVPHFEKMLCDNAGIIELMTLVWQHTRSPLYAARIDETVDWVLREMVSNDGAFATAIDADSDGEQGKFYTWTEAEIDEALGPNDAPMFKQVYGVTANGNWEGRNVLHRLGAMGFLRPDQEAILTRCRRMLLMARAARQRPARDDKALADWNGMMVAALAQAAAVFRKPEWHFAAVRAFWAIADKAGDGDVLRHVLNGAAGRNETTAEGYGQMARAALILFEITSDPRYLDKAKAWAGRLDAAFLDAARGGYFYSSIDARDTPVRIKMGAEMSTPNYNGVIGEVLARLFFLTGDAEIRKRSNDLVAAFGREIERQALACPTLLNAMEFMINTVQVVIVGDERAPETQNLIRAVLERCVPCRTLSVIRPGQKLHADHPAKGKGQEGGKPTAYVCVGQTCSPPVTDPQQLANGLVPPPFMAIAQAQQAAQRAANNR